MDVGGRGKYSSMYKISLEEGRDKLSLFELFLPLDGEKQCRGYVLFFHLITIGEKSEGNILKF